MSEGGRRVFIGIKVIDNIKLMKIALKKDELRCRHPSLNLSHCLSPATLAILITITLCLPFAKFHVNDCILTQYITLLSIMFTDPGIIKKEKSVLHKLYRDVREDNSIE